MPELIDGFYYAGSATRNKNKCGAKLNHKEEDDGTEEHPFREGRYCLQALGWGTEHAGQGRCKLHGGGSPNHMVAARREEMATAAVEMAEYLGNPEPIGDPMVEMFKMAAHVKQMHTIAQFFVAQLEDYEQTDIDGKAQIRPIIEFWEHAVDRCIMVFEKLIKLGLMEYKLKLETDVAETLYQIHRSVWENPRMNLTDAQLDLAKQLAFEEVVKAGGKLTPQWINDLDIDDSIVDAEVL